MPMPLVWQGGMALYGGFRGARLPRAATVSLLPSAVWRAGVVDALFYVTSSLIHTQFAYATVNHDLNSCSNNEQPNSQRKFSSGFTRDRRVKVSSCIQARLLT